MNYYNTNNPYAVGNGSWVSSSKMSPLAANNLLSNTHVEPWNDVRSVAIKWNQFVSGPRPAAPIWKESIGGFTQGKEMEYRIGGFGNWLKYFSDWLTYFTGKG